MRGAVLAAVLLSLALAVTPAAAITLPPGFADERVAGVAVPTDLSPLPDGGLLVTSQTGQLRILRGTTMSAPVLTLAVCDQRERGLLSVAAAPDFAASRQIYVFYTRPGDDGACPLQSTAGPFNRVSRFTLAADDTIDPASEQVVIDRMPSYAGTHNSGDMVFGKDGLLHVSIGDGGCDYARNSGCQMANDATRDLNALVGKVLRVRPDGSIPPGNPFTGAGTARCHETGRTTVGTKCREIYAWGLRNPFRMALHPGDGRIYVNDVGNAIWEEVDRLAPVDFGWNVREGPCATNSTTDCGPPPDGMVNPVFSYSHATNCRSITGGAFVPAGAWPAPYDGRYLFADYVCGRIQALAGTEAGGFTAELFAGGLGNSSAVATTFAGDSLYYTTYAGGGEVRRISYTGDANRRPTAALTTTADAGAAPLTVTLDASASSDPDGDALRYNFAFGDGTSTRTTSPVVSHTYAAGTRTARVTVADGRGGLRSASVRIAAGNQPPTAVIDAPAPDATFAVGDVITVRGHSEDAEDGISSDHQFWEVLLHHDEHTHPFVSRKRARTLTFTAPAPEDLAAAPTSYLEIRLEVRDAQGTRRIRRLDFQPHRVAIRLYSTPNGRQLTVDGQPVTTPVRLTSWTGLPVTLSAPDQDGATFVRWYHGGPQTNTITTPAVDANYRAYYSDG